MPVYVLDEVNLSKVATLQMLERILRTNLKSISTSMPTAFRYSHLNINISDYSEEKFTGTILPAIPKSQSQEKPREKPVWP